MSTPLSLDLPQGVAKKAIDTPRGSFSVLTNEDALTGTLTGTQTGTQTGTPTIRGGGEVALLLPGFMGSKEDFLAVLAPLAEHGIHAIAVDLRGQFESPLPDEGNAADGEGGEKYSLDLFAADVASVIAALPGKPHLVGHSFGGLVAREVVLADPLSVTTITLMNSGPGALPIDQQPLLQLFAQVLEANGLEAVWAAKQALEEAQGTQQPNDPEIRDFLTRRFIANSPRSLLGIVDALCTANDRTEELASVSPPTLVLFGSEDDAWLPEIQRAMGDVLDAAIVELPGLGHSIAVDDPKLTAETLADFWREHR